MLLTYWAFHLLFTIPQAIVLAALYRPLFSTRDGARTIFHCCIAVVWTLPWDAWIIYHRAWTYAPWAVTATVFGVPIEASRCQNPLTGRKSSSSWPKAS